MYVKAEQYPNGLCHPLVSQLYVEMIRSIVSIWKLTLHIILILAAIIFTGGVLLVLLGNADQTVLKLADYEISFTGVGIAITFKGAAMVIIVIRGILKSLEKMWASLSNINELLQIPQEKPMN